MRSSIVGLATSIILLVIAGTGQAQQLRAGDADQDLDYDQCDWVQVLVAAKYLTGLPATWGEGDFSGAPGGEPGNPPPGDGLFDQLDLIFGLRAGLYLTGPYAGDGSISRACEGLAISPGGIDGDDQTSIVYDPTTGELAVDAPAGVELTSINIGSAGSVFAGDPVQDLRGIFDIDSDNTIFKATIGGSFGSVSFGNVALAGLSEDFVANDLTVVGSLSGGGPLGDVDLIYIPEPSTIVFASIGLAGLIAFGRRRRVRRRGPVKVPGYGSVRRSTWGVPLRPWPRFLPDRPPTSPWQER